MKTKKPMAALATVVFGLTLSHAQQDQPKDASGPAPVSQTTDSRTDHDWGWIGLLGLAGLAGLLGRKREATRHDSRPDQTSNVRRVA
jgi:MYXO-CTERM domain-containing protein